jgi:hypothetical protein
VLVLVLTSQPSSTVGATGCPQFPQGALQDDVHRPPLHARLATLVLAHPRLHAPQWVVLELVFVSHPSSGVGFAGCVQLPKPPLHVELQVPPLHERLATFELEHTRLHAPQLSAFVLVLVSQPLSAVG